MKSIVVTGASRGIGRATVPALVAKGIHVWAAVRTDADEQALRSVGAAAERADPPLAGAPGITAHPEAVSVLRMDLTDADAIKAAGETVTAAGPLHGLVNNAGVAMPGPLEHVPIEMFRRQIEINLVGQLAVTQAMMPALRAAKEEAGDARIVLVGSIGGRGARPPVRRASPSQVWLLWGPATPPPP